MKIADERFTFKAWPYGRESVCHLRAWVHDGRTVAVTSELADNPGPSVTNGAEGLHARLVARFGPSVIHVEHYGPAAYGSPRDRDRYDLVTMGDAARAVWKPLNTEAVEAIIGEPLEALVAVR